MSRTPIQTWFFALVVVRRGDRYLLVREGARHGGGYYLPAGRVEPCETLAEAAIRETLEETGVPVALDGIMRLEHSPTRHGDCRVRAFFLAHPTDERPPKQVADRHSEGAVWVTLEEASQLQMRGPDALAALKMAARGATMLPITALVQEADPF